MTENIALSELWYGDDPKIDGPDYQTLAALEDTYYMPKDEEDRMCFKMSEGFGEIMSAKKCLAIVYLYTRHNDIHSKFIYITEQNKKQSHHTMKT